MSAPDASGSTSDCLTAAGITPSDLWTDRLACFGSEASGWSTLAFPTALADSAFLATEDNYTQKIGAFSVDLSSFLTYCATVLACQYEAYLGRYDGLALGHYFDLTRSGTEVEPPGDETAGQIENFTGVCDGETNVCWGWSLYADYKIDNYVAGTKSCIDYEGNEYCRFTSSVGSAECYYDYYSQFYMGVVSVELSTTSPSAANFEAEIMDKLSYGEIYTRSSYGFSSVYWMAEEDEMDDWPEARFAYRFQAIDLPRLISGDTMNLYSISNLDETHGQVAEFVIAGSSSLTAALALSAGVASLF